MPSVVMLSVVMLNVMAPLSVEVPRCRVMVTGVLIEAECSLSEGNDPE